MRLGIYAEMGVQKETMLRFARKMVETWGADEVLVPTNTKFGKTVQGKIGCNVIEAEFDMNVADIMDMVALMVTEDMANSDWCKQIRESMAKEGKAVLVERIE